SGRPRLSPRATTKRPMASSTARMPRTAMVIGPETSAAPGGAVRHVDAGRPDEPGLAADTGAACQSGGNGPGGAGRGPYGTGASTPSFDSQPASKPPASPPSAALNAASSLTPSA